MMTSPRPLTHVLLALLLVACIWNVMDLPSFAISGKSLAQGTDSGVGFKRFLSAENASPVPTITQKVVDQQKGFLRPLENDGYPAPMDGVKGKGFLSAENALPAPTITQVDAVMPETFVVGVTNVDVDVAAVKKQPSVPSYLIDAIGSPPLDISLPVEKSAYSEPAAFMPGPTINQADGVNLETMMFGAQNSEIIMPVAKTNLLKSNAAPETSTQPTTTFTDPSQPIGNTGITTSMNSDHSVPQKVVNQLPMDGAKDKGSEMYSYAYKFSGNYR